MLRLSVVCKGGSAGGPGSQAQFCAFTNWVRPEHHPRLCQASAVMPRQEGRPLAFSKVFPRSAGAGTSYAYEGYC